jgi:DNA-binding beta-propeller fold protein YncE
MMVPHARSAEAAPSRRNTMIALVILAWTCLGSAPAQAPSGAAMIDVKVVSAPAGGEIEIDGALSGTTPSTFKLAPGEYRIAIIKDGHKKWERNVKVSVGAPIVVTAALVPSAEPAPGPAHIGALPKPAAPAIGARAEFYAITRKPASLAVIDGSKPEVLATVSFEGDPFGTVLSKDNSKLYVLHGLPAKDETLTISIVDLATRAVSAKIQVDHRIRQMEWSLDGRFLVCESIFGQTGIVVLIDPATNKIVAEKSSERMSFKTLVAADGSRIFFVNLASAADKKKGTPAYKPSITTFDRDHEKPLEDVELPDIAGVVLSPDRQWLYALEPGHQNPLSGHQPPASVAVIDVETGKLAATHWIGIAARELSSDPVSGLVTVFARQSEKGAATTLYVLRGKSEPLEVNVGEAATGLRPLGRADGVRMILAQDKLRFLDRQGRLLNAGVSLTPSDTGFGALGSMKVGGGPDEVMVLPSGDRMVMTIVGRDGAPTGKLAFVDLKAGMVTNVVLTGRSGVRFAKNALAVADAAMSVAASARMATDPKMFAQYSRNPGMFSSANLYSPPPPNVHLATSPDGRFAYAFNNQTDDITIVTSDYGSILKTIPFGNCTGIGTVRGGKFMAARNRGAFLLIDTATNDFTEYKVPGGFHTLVFSDNAPVLAALTGKGIMLWDTDKGTPLGTLALPEPIGLLEARANRDQ